MKIGLIDVDGHNFPNLALMKLSAYHKSIGDSVELIKNPIDSMMGDWDKVYKAKVFSFSNDYFVNVNADQIIEGGTGYDLSSKLEFNVEHVYPDYDLYNEKVAYGFLTRGCPRNCPFCIVSKKEGLRSYKVADLSEFWNGQKDIKLLDPNLLASSEKIDLLRQLVDSGAKIDITQGFDIRLVDDQVIDLINNLNLERVHFAWDNYEFRSFEMFEKYRKKLRYGREKIGVYVLINFNTTFDQDIERIMKLRNLNLDPYVMIYNKHCLLSGDIHLKIQRWVNNKRIFWSKYAYSFDLYLKNFV